MSDTMPTVTAWPVCKAPRSRTDDRECDVPYVLRRSLSLSRGWIWLWSSDCKHKRGAVQPHDADGPCGELTA